MIAEDADLTILNETLNFYKLYQHCMGRSEVPPIFHYWCCVSMIAAILEDRVYFDFYKDRPIFPNLFIMLLGPSGGCKGLAISEAVDLVDRTSSVVVNKYRGSITAPRLVDKLGGRIEKKDDQSCVIDDAKLWLVMDELANDVGAGGPIMVRGFLTMMTELYTGHYVFETGTRMHGDVTVDNACVNWLPGTTKAWLKKVLTKDMVDSGFTPRVLPVVSDYAPERIRWPEYPDDRDLVYDHLKARLFALRCLKGRFDITSKADAVYSKWYLGRTEPDEIMLPFWHRQRVLMFKLAMIFSAMDAGPLVINSNHVSRAIYWVKQANVWHEELVESASSTVESDDVKIVRAEVQKAGELTRSELLRKLYRQKILKDRLNRAMGDLLQREEVVQGWQGKAITYKWKG